jgi:hypothetical protein
VQHRSFFKVKLERSEPYRRLVAALPCINCGIETRSQCAHPNKGGKGMRLKTDDRLCFPLCADQLGRVGCHTQHDQYKLLPEQEIAQAEQDWGMRTRARIIADGTWPARLPRYCDE